MSISGLFLSEYISGPGADPELRRAEGGAKNFGVFRVKNHDFTPKNHIFSNFREVGAPPGSASVVYINDKR